MYGKKRVKFISYCITLAIVKCGGWNNFIVWKCMSWNNMGMLIEVKKKINANQYCRFWVIEWWCYVSLFAIFLSFISLDIRLLT